jgi:nitrite reductase/ring-hydroxylating ferredoxin subunit
MAVADAPLGPDNNKNAIELARTALGDADMAFTKVATVPEVPAGTSKQVVAGGRTLALFNVGGAFHAIDDTCPHRGGPLWEGELAGVEVTCPWHGARFDVTTGANLGPPARTGVASYKVQVVGDEIQIDLP